MIRSRSYETQEQTSEVIQVKGSFNFNNNNNNILIRYKIFTTRGIKRIIIIIIGTFIERHICLCNFVIGYRINLSVHVRVIGQANTYAWLLVSLRACVPYAIITAMSHSSDVHWAMVTAFDPLPALVRGRVIIREKKVRGPEVSELGEWRSCSSTTTLPM